MIKTRLMAAVLLLSTGMAGLCATAAAGVTPQLPYPKSQPSALEIMQQVYFVNHFYALKNFAITKVKRKITVLVSRAKGKRPTTNTLERYLNNDYENDPVVRAKDLAIFRSGKLRGTGLLITDYDDDSKGQSYMIWLPALHKVRRFAQPAQDDSWGGAGFHLRRCGVAQTRKRNTRIPGKGSVQDLPERYGYSQETPQPLYAASGERVLCFKGKRSILK
ncbi:DUF1329 domain-containing protein [Thiolapillus sp.]